MVATLAQESLRGETVGVRNALATLAREIESQRAGDTPPRGQAGQGGLPTSFVITALSAAARHLGALWDEDDLSFTDVTVGVGVLQEVFRCEMAGLEACAPLPRQGRHILLLPVPGEQHGFGAAMARSSFRQAGWSVYPTTVADLDLLATLCASEWFDAVGFSLCGEGLLPAARLAVAAVRRNSLNPNPLILLGGPLAAAQPGLVGTLGADLVISDTATALDCAERQLRAREAATPWRAADRASAGDKSLVLG
jgi:hypothetical protein